MEFYITVSLIIGLVLVKLNKSLIKIPVIFYIFLMLYNFLPYITYKYFNGDIFYADYRFVDDAFILFVLGLIGYLGGCIYAWQMRHRIVIRQNVKIDFPRISIVATFVFIIVIIGLVLTGQIFHIGSYGKVDSAHKSFSTLLHFTLIFNIIFAMYIYSLMNKKNYKYVRNLTIIFTILFILIGNRSVIIGIILCIAYYVSERKKNLIRDMVGMILLFISLVVIQSFRGAGNISGDWYEGAIITIDRFKNMDILVYFLGIQSDNLGVFSYIMGRMESENYYMGYTYLESLVRLIPGFVRRSAGIADEGEIFNHLQWLGHDGIAFSLMGEMYMNFGSVGLLMIMFILGVLITMLSNYSDRKKGIYTIIMLSMYSVISTLARNDSALSIKQFIYGVILVYILFVFSRGVNEINNVKRHEARR